MTLKNGLCSYCLEYFDDFLGILDSDFDNTDFLIFYGKSGSGKSTYINYLLNYNKTLKNKKYIKISNYDNRNISNTDIIDFDIIIFDEIYNFFDYIKLLRFISYRKKIIISSHISYFFYFFLYIFGKMEFYRTDSDIGKIQRYLENNNINFSYDTVKKYVINYRSNFNDLNIILEGMSGKDFDKIFTEFHKRKSISCFK